LYGAKENECERCPSRFIKNNYLDKKLRREGKSGRKLVLKMG
jgi:hypothetical protein